MEPIDTHMSIYVYIYVYEWNLKQLQFILTFVCLSVCQANYYVEMDEIDR